MTVFGPEGQAFVVCVGVWIKEGQMDEEGSVVEVGKGKPESAL